MDQNFIDFNKYRTLEDNERVRPDDLFRYSYGDTWHSVGPKVEDWEVRKCKEIYNIYTVIRLIPKKKKRIG